jgi:hypothetical protein
MSLLLLLSTSLRLPAEGFPSSSTVLYFCSTARRLPAARFPFIIHASALATAEELTSTKYSYLRITALRPQAHMFAWTIYLATSAVKLSDHKQIQYSIQYISSHYSSGTSLPLPYCTSASSHLPAEGFPSYASAAHHTGHKRMESLLLATSLPLQHIILLTTYQHFEEGLS